MEPCHLIAEEWGSLSGQFTAEEADFMSQLLGHGSNNYSVTEKHSYFPSNVANNTNFLCSSSQENNSSTDSGNTFTTPTKNNHLTLKNDSLSMVLSLEDAKLISHSFSWDDDNLSHQINESNLEAVKGVIADNNLHAKEEHEMMVCEPYDEHRSKNLENPAKRPRSSIEVSKNMRNVRKNSRATSNPAATDAQSIYARRRRERINERLKILQNLVPNGTKVDISTMLEEAVQYVKFLQHQIKLLSSDDLWMYAPLAYNGINIGLDHIM